MMQPDVLLAGPRGRALLLRWVLSLSSQANPLLAGPTMAQEIGDVVAEIVRADQIPSDQRLRDMLADVVACGVYWQEPSGVEALSNEPAIVEALSELTKMVCVAPSIQWWDTPIDRCDQWSVQWEGAAVCGRFDVQQYRAELLADVQRARRERPSDPTANWSGQWWSVPGQGAPTTTRSMDGSPVGLWYVEDPLGWRTATVYSVQVAQQARVLEVSEQVWVDLCRRFPIDVTADKRHDWYRATGRDGQWVIPDWAAVAEHVDGVHLTVASYLSSAGRALEVDQERSTVIAGWAPDETIWLNPAVVTYRHPTRWVNQDQTDWIRQE